jgi:hypothetical protein
MSSDNGSVNIGRMTPGAVMYAKATTTGAANPTASSTRIALRARRK